MNFRWMRNSFIYLLIIVAVIAILFTLLSEPLGGTNEVPISQVVSMAARGQLDLIEVRGDDLDITVCGVLEADRHRQAGSELAMNLTFRCTGADRPPRNQVGNELRHDRIEEFGAYRQADFADIQ